MNVFKQEFKMHLRSAVTWAISIALLTLVFMSLFPSFADEAAMINEAMKNFPPQLLAAFGLAGADLSTVLGFFGFLFIFVQIFLAIQAANYGFSLVSIEEREWTADFLLSKPVTRTSILTAKLLAAITALAITAAVTWVVSLAAASIFSGGRSYGM